MLLPVSSYIFSTAFALSPSLNPLIVRSSFENAFMLFVVLFFVILLSFFLGMSDTEIARIMRVVNSTIHEHKKKALKLMKSELEKRGMEE